MLALLLILMVVPGGDDVSKVALKQLMVQRSIGECGDKFLSLVPAIVEHKKQIYLADYQNSRVLVLDQTLNLVKVIGREGQGPGELQGVFGIRIAKDLLFAHNQFAWKMEVFDLAGNFIKSVFLPEIPMDTSFAVDSGLTLYMPSFNKEKPVSAYDLDGNLLSRFGEWVVPERPEHKGSANARYLSIASTPKGQEVLISACQSEPLLEVYSLDGKRIVSKDLRRSPLLRKRITVAQDWRKENPNNPSRHVIFQSLSTENSDVYVLYYGETRPDQVLHLRLSENDLVEVANFQLTRELGTPLSVFSFLRLKEKDSWLAFENTSSQLHMLKLSHE